MNDSGNESENPKAEARDPKEGRNSKSELFSPGWAAVPQPTDRAGISGACRLALGLRVSVFFRPSGCGLRISILLLFLVASACAQTLSDDALAQIRFEQKLNAQVSLNLPFRDEDGQPARLSQYFGHKPVLLVLGYYECPMLCTLVLNGMVESAADMKWSIGREFEVVNVSINPHETPALAAAKKRTYVKRYGRSGAAQGWHFLTGEEGALRQLADEVGFRYAYDPTSKQYAHPSGLVVLTPQGKISGYLFGVTFAPKDLYGALRTAAGNEVGSPIQQLILLCFHYNPITGKYSGTIIVILRVLGVATILGFLGLIGVLLRRGPTVQATLVEIQKPKAESRNSLSEGESCVQPTRNLEPASPATPGGSRA